MNRVLTFIIHYWYYFFIFSTIFHIFFPVDLTNYLMPIAAIVGIDAMFKIRWRTIDTIVLIAILYCLVSFIFSDYPTKLYLYGIKKQVMAMMFYFIARSMKFRDDSFINHFKWPMLFVIVSGIYLYFLPPAWYTSYRYAQLTSEEGSFSFYEITRMSSFFPHPYFLGYGSCFFIIVMITKILFERKISYLQYVWLGLATFTLFFSQMRITMVYTLVFLCAVSIYHVFILQGHSRFFKFVLILAPLALILFYIIENIVSADFLNYVSHRTTESENNIVEGRFQQFSYFIKYFSFWGNGLGKFGHTAVGMGLPSIADNEYIRTICEIGYLGFSLVIIPIIYSIIVGLIQLKKNFTYVCILLFFPFAMLGATPLESGSQHSFLLWFCIGHIINQTSNAHFIKNKAIRLLQNQLYDRYSNIKLQ